MSSATARLNAFSFGYRDAVPLTGVLYQKPLSRPVRAIALPADTLGGLVLEKVLPHRRRTRKCDIFALKRGGNDGLHYRYDRRKKRSRECGIWATSRAEWRDHMLRPTWQVVASGSEYVFGIFLFTLPFGSQRQSLLPRRRVPKHFYRRKARFHDSESLIA